MEYEAYDIQGMLVGSQKEERAMKEPNEEINLQRLPDRKDCNHVQGVYMENVGHAHIGDKVHVRNTKNTVRVINGCPSCQGGANPSVPEGTAGDVEIDIKGMRKGLEALKKFGWTILSGPPESGKTNLAWALLEKLRAESYSVHDWCRLCRQHPPLPDASSKGWALLIDSQVGDVCLDEERYLRVKALLETLRVKGLRSQCLVVLTVYPHILKEIEFRERGHDRLLANSDVVVHLAQESFSPALDSSNRPRVSSKNLKLMQRMLSNPSTKSTVPALMALSMEEAGDFLNATSAVQSRLQQLGMDSISCSELEQRASYLRGNILSLKVPGFSNRSLYNTAALALGSSVFLPVLLKVCGDERFLMDHVRVVGLPEKSKETDGDPENFVTVSFDDGKGENLKLLMRRMYDLMLAGKSYPLCQHPALASQSFLDRFEQFCREVDKKKGMEQLMVSKHREEQQHLLYYSLWESSDIFTSWCLKHTIQQCSDKTLKTEAVISALIGSIFSADSLSSGKEQTKRILTEVQGLKFKPAPKPKDTHFELSLPLVTSSQAGRKCNWDDEKELAELLIDMPASLLSMKVTDNSAIVKISAEKWYLALRLLIAQAMDETDCDGNTVLHLAAEAGDGDAVNTAINRNNSLTAKNAQGLTPYELAQKRSGKKWCLLVSDQRRNHFLETIEACGSGDVEKVKKLLALHGVSMQERGDDGYTLLHYACREGQQDVASLLLALGADPNIRNKHRHTPLHVACHAGHLEVARVLVEAGARVDLQAGSITSLHLASRMGHEAVIHFLVDRGADINHRGFIGYTALHEACIHGHVGAARLLLSCRADVNVRDGWGNRPLHLVSRADRLDLAQLLLQHRADLRARNDRGHSPLDVAANKRRLLALVQPA